MKTPIIVGQIRTLDMNREAAFALDQMGIPKLVLGKRVEITQHGEIGTSFDFKGREFHLPARFVKICFP